MGLGKTVQALALLLRRAELGPALVIAPTSVVANWEQCRQRLAVPIERHHDRKRQAALARVVCPFLLRRTKAEVAPELPARTEMNQTIELGPTERRLYEAERIEILENLAKSAAAGIGDDARQRIKILAALTRLRLLCCHPRQIGRASCRERV